MKRTITYILILIILFTIFIILKFYKSDKNVFDDITIFSLWNNSQSGNEYEISLKDKVEIDVFTTINNNRYKKIAPGCKGEFVLKFSRPMDIDYYIEINEKTSKPQNLIFIFENRKYKSIKELEYIINEKFADAEKISINWEWKYYVNEIQDMQDTADGQMAQKYLFEIKVIMEDKKGLENES